MQRPLNAFTRLPDSPRVHPQVPRHTPHTHIYTLSPAAHSLTRSSLTYTHTHTHIPCFLLKHARTCLDTSLSRGQIPSEPCAHSSPSPWAHQHTCVQPRLPSRASRLQRGHAHTCLPTRVPHTITATGELGLDVSRFPNCKEVWLGQPRGPQKPSDWPNRVFQDCLGSKRQPRVAVPSLGLAQRGKESGDRDRHWPQKPLCSWRPLPGSPAGRVRPHPWALTHPGV